MPTFLICSAPDVLTALLTNQVVTVLDRRCVEIKVKPYLSPRIVYQYSNEDPITIKSQGGELSYELIDKVIEEPGLTSSLRGTRGIPNASNILEVLHSISDLSFKIFIY